MVKITCLQVEQLLCEVRMAEDKKKAAQEFISRLKASLQSMSSDQAQHRVCEISQR